MGLLDDAIREHLDLKRRRGADPSEIEQAEREALGPVRRAPEALEPTEFGPEDLEPAAPEEYHYDHAPELDGEEPYADEIAAGGHLEEPLEPEPYDSEPHPAAYESEPHPAAYESELPPAPYESEQQTELYEREPHPAPYQAEPGEYEPEEFAPHEPASFDEPEPLTEPPPAHEATPEADESLGGETVEYRLEDEVEGEDEAEGEDVLEETPEFLQDTPEHDRLWFEQRPPRDFDFDG